jgi:hypothetical protein
VTVYYIFADLSDTGWQQNMLHFMPLNNP